MHDLQVDIQFDLQLLSVQIVCSSYDDPTDGLEPGCLASRLASRLASCLVVFTTADVDLEGRVRTVFKVLIRHFHDSVSAQLAER